MRKMRPNLFRDICGQPYDDSVRLKLYNSTKASLQLMQRMSLLESLKLHNGCVNSICWNSTGSVILSASDDQRLVVTNAHTYEILFGYYTSHRANIFSAKFLPNSGDVRIVSCSGEGLIIYTDLMRRRETFDTKFTCHSGTTYEIATVPDEPHSFLSCGEDGTVRLFDLRIKKRCYTKNCTQDILISCKRAVTALSVNPVFPNHIAIGSSDSTVRIFDRRTLSIPATDSSQSEKPLYSFTVPEFEGNSYRITSLCYSPNGQDVLVSYSSDHVYLFNVKDQGSMHLRKDTGVGKGKGKKPPLQSPQRVRRLRMRGDWSDTGPAARPEREDRHRRATEVAQSRPVVHPWLMQRMVEVLSRMLNDPATRAALSGCGEDSFQEVLDQQQNSQANGEGPSADPSEERSNESGPARLESDQADNTRALEEEEEGTSRSQADRPSTSRIDDPQDESKEIEDASIPTSSTSNRTIGQRASQPDPVEAESSRSEQSRNSEDLETNSKPAEDGEDMDHYPQTSMDSGKGSVMKNLQDKLTTMRDGFLERHGSEPAVNLTYSDKSSTSGTISLGVADEFIRDGYHAGPSGCQSRICNDADAGPSNSRLQYKDTRQKTDEDTYIDSDDEDASPSKRFVHPMERKMEEDNASQSHENFDETYLTELCVKKKYMGHRNARTMIKEANFWGDDFVMSGSDCGHVFVWERETAKLCMLLEADHHVVNCVQPHPYLPILATSGIDYDVKLWAPLNEESSFDEKFADDLMKRNAVMLDETKDTITVPALVMLRMLTCINQIRRGGCDHRRRRSGHDPDELRGG